LKAAGIGLALLHWLRRLVLVAGWAGLAAGLAAAIAGWWLTATPAGVQWALGQVERHVPALSIGASRGTLWRGLVLGQVEWAPEQGARVELAQARIRIDPKALGQGELRVTDLALVDTVIRLPPADPDQPPAARPFDPADLSLPPLSLVVERLLVARLVIEQDGRRYEVTDGRAAARLAGRAERPRLALDLDALALRLPGDMRLDMSGAASVEWSDRLALHGHGDLLLEHPAGWLSGRIEATGELPGGIDLRPQLAWMGVDGRPAAFCGRMRLDRRRLTIDTLVADLLGGRVSVSGTAGWSPTPGLELTGRAESLDPGRLVPGSPGSLSFDLAAELAGADGWLPVHGTLSLSGLAGRLAGESIEAVDIDVGLGDDLARMRLSGRAGGGELRLDGRLDARRRLRAQWRIDALPLAGGTAGIDSLHLATRGRLEAELPDWNRPLTAADWLSRSRVALEDGRLSLVERGDDGRAVSLRLGAALADGRLAIERMDFEAPGATLSASGALALAPDWRQWRFDGMQGSLAVPALANLPWDLVARLPGIDLSPFRPAAAQGAVDLAWAVSGPILAPFGKLDARIDGLRLAGWSLGGARMTARIDAPEEKTQRSEPPMHVSLNADALAAPGRELRVERLAFEAKGSPAAQQATLDVEGPVDLHLGLRGGMRAAGEDPANGPGWQGRLFRLDIEPPAGHPWHLAAPADLSVTRASQRLGSSCLRPEVTGPAAGRPGALCLTGQHAGQRLAARMEGDLPLAALWALWPGRPESIHWPGRMSIDAEARLDQSGRTASVELVLPADEVRLAGGEDLGADAEAAVIRYPETRFAARLADERVEARLAGGVGDGLVVEAQGGARLDDGTLDGEVSIQRVSLARLFALADRLFGPLPLPISDPQGRLGGRLSITGRLDAPRFSGRLQGEDLGFASLPTGTEYRDGRLEIEIAPDGELALTGDLLGEADTPPRPVFSQRRVDEVESPKSRGRLTIEGSGRVTAPDDWRLVADVAGEAVPVLRLPTLAVDARPALNVELSGQGGRVDGRVFVPLGIARLGALPESARGNSEDLVIVGEKSEEGGSTYPLSGNIEVVLGDAVSLRGRGFATRLTGGLDLRLRSEEPLGAYGEIRLEDGRYQAYGQTLSVERGRLIFAGPLTAPGLDVVASRRIDDQAGTVVGLAVTGELDSPQTEVFSRPPTSSSDALSLLLTGRRLSAGSDADASLLLGAIAGLGIRQGDDLAQQIHSAFGLDELGLTSDGGVAGARLSLGKRIGENLLVRYAVGVFDGIGEVITRYRINKSLHLELSSSAQSQSADLIYQIDRGRPEN
jgi:translocation and assembly module TamB